MEFKQRACKLNNRLSFWNHFKDEERFLFYNPIKKEYVLGAKKLNPLDAQNEQLKAPYTFSAMTYFDTVKDDKWSEFNSETSKFEYYFVEKKDKDSDDTSAANQILYYKNTSVDIIDIETTEVKHIYICKEDDYDQWKELFTKVSEKIKNNYVNKVVISRELKIESNADVDIESIISNLIKNNPDSYIFAYFKNGKTFLGATPEVIVQKNNNEFLSHALAGTILKSKVNDQEQKNVLLSDVKNRHEHKIVIDSIVKDMSYFTSDINIEQTGILSLRNIHHIQTKITAHDDKNHIYDWVKKLHPTPALGGNPKAEAKKVIQEHETHERGLYAAPIGLIDKSGNGIFVAGIRSALIDGKNIYAYAGAGIVDKSVCKSEYDETNNKFRTIIESL